MTQISLFLITGCFLASCCRTGWDEYSQKEALWLDEERRQTEPIDAHGLAMFLSWKKSERFGEILRNRGTDERLLILNIPPDVEAGILLNGKIENYPYPSALLVGETALSLQVVASVGRDYDELQIELGDQKISRELVWDKAFYGVVAVVVSSPDDITIEYTPLSNY